MSTNKALQICDDIIGLLNDNMEETKTNEETWPTSKGVDKQTYVEIRTKYSKGENVSQMAQLGFGTWLSKPGEVERAVKCALDCGYRHIDGAFVYGNEPEIGRAYSSRLGENKIKRSDVFITSKLWNSFRSKELVRKQFNKTLSDLGLKYLDLFLIHWPYYFKNEGWECFPRNEDGTMRYGDHVDIKETWSAMESLVEEGLVKHIGLSNYSEAQIDEVLSFCKIRPAVLQVECHPILAQTNLMKYCKSKNIVFQSYSPLGGYNRPWRQNENEPKLFNNEKIVNIGKKYGLTGAQVLLRWQLDRGNVVLSKSVTPSRIQTNIEVWGAKLTDEDMKIIDSLNKNERFFPPKIKNKNGEWVYRESKHPYFPWPDEVKNNDPTRSN